MTDTVSTYEGRIAKVQGPARSGKTEELVRRCAALLKRGVDPDAILVEVSTAFAASAFRRRLRAKLEPDAGILADKVLITRTLELCSNILSTPEAIASTERVSRLLNTGEYTFFLEDMKTLGQPVRRLRKMLDFFYRQWSGLEPSEAWLIGGEEEITYSHLVSTLSLRSAMLPQEAPMICANYLKSDAGQHWRGRFDHVLCDDYQNLSKAEQACLCLLAGKQLIVCGNPNQTTASGTAFPCPEGFAHFDELRKEVAVFELGQAFGNPSVSALGNSLCDHGSMDPDCRAAIQAEDASDIVSIKWDTPEDEMNGLTKYLRVLLDEEEDLHEERTCVLVPNKNWARMAQSMLKKRGFSVSVAGARGTLGGDPRESSRAKALVAYTKLNLIADPTDPVAWRSWCGFDNFLTNSDAWKGLEDFAIEQGISMLTALERTASLTSEPFPRAGMIAQRWSSGQDLIAKHTGRKGFALLRALDAAGLPEFEDLEALMVGDEDAASLFALVRSHISDPTFPDDPHTLHIASYGSMAGTDYDNVFALGVVDGFMPRRDAFEVISTDEDRKDILDAERRMFYDAVSKATKRLVFSSFATAPLEIAERTKMQVVRVKAQEGERVAVLRPSLFLEEAGSAYPGTIGGQSALAEYGLN